MCSTVTQFFKGRRDFKPFYHIEMGFVKKDIIQGIDKVMRDICERQYLLKCSSVVAIV